MVLLGHSQLLVVLIEAPPTPAGEPRGIARHTEKLGIPWPELATTGAALLQPQFGDAGPTALQAASQNMGGQQGAIDSHGDPRFRVPRHNL